MSIFEQIKELYRKIKLLKEQANIPTNQNLLYDVAFSSIGKDASPLDSAEDEFGCADSVSMLLNRVVMFPDILSTATMLNYLIGDARFEEIQSPEKGCIIISATGTGNGQLSNGHVGIVGKNKSPDGTLWVMSNNSELGSWEVDWTINSWRLYYNVRGGFPMRYFRLL